MNYFSSMGIIPYENKSEQTTTLRISYAKDIIKTVAKYHEVPLRIVFKKCRHRDVVRVRKQAIYLIMEKVNGIYLREVAELFGKELNYCHKMVIYNRDETRKFLSAKQDEGYKRDIFVLKTLI